MRPETSSTLQMRRVSGVWGLQVVLLSVSTLTEYNYSRSMDYVLKRSSRAECVHSVAYNGRVQRYGTNYAWHGFISDIDGQTQDIRDLEPVNKPKRLMTHLVPLIHPMIVPKIHRAV